MKIRIERIYGRFYVSAFDKYEILARCYVNGKYSYKRLFFATKESSDAVQEGMVIDY